jgi:predicted deacetylase
MNRRPGRLLLTSIHDVSPRFESPVDRLVEKLSRHVGQNLAMLVVPNHWGDCPITPGSPFASRLRSWAEAGIEMFLHGYFHRDDCDHHLGSDRLRARLMTAGEGEFLGLSKPEASRRIATGRSLIEDVIGRPIDGFVAPAWLYSEGTLEALADQRIAIAEDHLRVWSPRTGATLGVGPVITWASRTRLRAASSLGAAALVRRLPLKVLRVGVHPPDCDHPPILRSIEKTIAAAAKGRTAARYSEAFRSLASAA